MLAEAIDCKRLRHALEAVDLAALATPLLAHAQHIYQTHPHGDWKKWQSIIAQLTTIAPVPTITPIYDFNRHAIRIGSRQDYNRTVRTAIKNLLLELQPWRKGPFELFGILIDSEWHANLKWERLAGKISALHGRRILDVGCGNGYYLWRMLGEQASFALGIDPSQLFIAQFNALKLYCPDISAFVLPLTSEQFLRCNEEVGAGGERVGFDSVFSMGVLSHRSKPREHLRELFQFARRGGELVIETLVVDGNRDTMLVIEGRYAKMRNVYSLPSALALEHWLQRIGLTDIRLLDISQTTTAEQRITEWMQFESLADFLDPADSNKTVEGYPAPQRAIFVCRKPH